jgi:hypothetical protein
VIVVVGDTGNIGRDVVRGPCDPRAGELHGNAFDARCTRRSAPVVKSSASSS